MPPKFLSSPSPADMPKTADVIIIGGGPAGAGALWALERAQPGIQAVLIEKGRQIASGASNASLENFRTAWPSRCNAVMMARSIDVFHHAEDYFGEGTQLGVRVRGYIWAGVTERGAAKLRGEVEHLHSVGLTHIEYLDEDEAQHRYGWLGPKLIAAKVDPAAGWLDSYALINAMAKTAHGATILLDVPDLSIRVEGGRVVGVETPSGFIASPRVLIAAGAESRRIGRTAGVELPIVVRPRQSFTTHYRHVEYPADGPMVIGAFPFPHVRPEAQTGAIFGWEYSWNAKRVLGEAKLELEDPIYPVEQWKDPRFPSVVPLLFARQFGDKPGTGFASPGYLRGVDHRAGYYVYRDETTAYETHADGTRHFYESQRAIIDAMPGVDGLFVSMAHVGHGIMSAPAAGEIAAAHVLNLPLSDPLYAQFGIDVPFVEHDASGLAADEVDNVAAENAGG